MADATTAAMMPSGAAPQTQSQADRMFEEILQQNQNFDHYERLFQEVLTDLENDDILETFRREYETLHNSFMRCHESEKRLLKKCQDLTAEINSSMLKVRAAEELSSGDKNTIEQLNKEIQKARTKVQQSKESEVSLKEKIKQLKGDIKELDQQVSKGAVGVGGHDQTITELTRVRADLLKQQDVQKGQLIAIQHDIAHLENRVHGVEEEKAAQDADLLGLRNATGMKNAEMEEQHDRKVRKEHELKDVKEDLAKHQKIMVENQANIATSNAEIKKLEEKVAKSKEETEKIVRDVAALNRKMQSTRQELQEVSEANEQLAKEATALRNQLKIKEGEVSSLTREKLKQEKLVEAIANRNTLVEEQRVEAEHARDTLRNELQQNELNISSLSCQAENDRKQIEDLKRERDILNKNYLKAQSATQRQKDWLVVKESQRRNLEHQIRGFERFAQKQRELIHQLTKEAEQYEQEAVEAGRRFASALEDVKSQEQLVAAEQKNIQDDEGKLKQQQTLLEAVLNERNVFSKNLLQLHSEINEMRRRFKIMLGQIEQLKDEIKQKERELVNEEVKVNQLIKERKNHEIQIDACKKKTEKREKTIEAYNSELHRLNQIIAEADAEKARQKRDHVNVVNERDILGTQLIRRNDELAQVYEKIRIQQSMLKKGEVQYNDRLKEVQQLNLRVHQLRSELNSMQSFASRLPDLKLLSNKTSRELTREQCRVRALLDEADNPLNVHRFRRLEGSEPHTFELLGTVQQLQRDLIDKSNEVEEKERLIAEREKLYVELKAIIARQPGPEVAEQLNVYQETLQKKSSQMKAMRASLRHFQEQVEHYKSRYDELKGELNEINNTYKRNRRAQGRNDERQRAINEMLGRPADAPATSGTEGNEQGGGDLYVGYTAPPRPPSDAQAQRTDGAPPAVAPVTDDVGSAPVQDGPVSGGDDPQAPPNPEAGESVE